MRYSLWVYKVKKCLDSSGKLYCPNPRHLKHAWLLKT